MSADLELLMEMHRYKRPAGGPTEQEYRQRFLVPLGVQEDKFGNLILDIGENPTVLWSSHTDSVHRGEGKQRIVFDGKYIALHKKSKASCLGADDAAGNFIMMKMIEAKVPGRYIFHAQEEIGRIGSENIAKNTPELLKGIQAAVAFDRKGTDSVITHQMGERGASDEFARSLAAQLPDGFKPDANGSFTDTKSYHRLVPECTNVAVGYYDAHTSAERLDVDHLFRLRDAMIKIDAAQLVIERDPSKVEEKQFSFGGFGGLSRLGRGPRDFFDLCFSYPEDVATVLESMPLDFEQFKNLVLFERDQRRAERFPTLRKAS